MNLWDHLGELRRRLLICLYVFMAGVVFSVLWVFPRAVQFLLTLKAQHLVPMLSVEAYLQFFILLAVAFGILFELPLALHLLAKLGVLKPDFLMQNRKIFYFMI